MGSPTMPTTKREKRDRAVAELLRSESDYVSDLKVSFAVAQRARGSERKRERESPVSSRAGMIKQEQTKEYNPQRTKSVDFSKCFLVCREPWAAVGCRPRCFVCDDTRTHTYAHAKSFCEKRRLLSHGTRDSASRL